MHFNMRPAYFISFFTNVARSQKILAEQWHLCARVPSSCSISPTQCRSGWLKPTWTELNLYLVHDYSSTRLVFLNNLFVFPKPFSPSFLYDTKHYMLIDNQQCWVSGAFSANLCPSGCQRVFTAASVPTLLAVAAPVGGAKAWQGLSMLSVGARQSDWIWLRLLASCQREKSICRQWLALTVPPVLWMQLTVAREEAGDVVNIMCVQDVTQRFHAGLRDAQWSAREQFVGS